MVTKRQVLDAAERTPNYGQVLNIVGKIFSPWSNDEVEKLREACSHIHRWNASRLHLLVEELEYLKSQESMGGK